MGGGTSGPLASPSLNRGLGHLPTHLQDVPPSGAF